MSALSPAAQAVLNKTTEQVLADRCILMEHIAAAALRAAADQVVPEEKTTPILESGYEVTRAKWEQRETTRRELLAIAAELDGKQNQKPTERTP